MTVSAGRLHLEAVSFAIAGNVLVDNVSLVVEPGEILGLLGPNGAGKSSLLRTVYGVNRPTSGTVCINGENAWRKPRRWMARHVGAVLQNVPGDFPLNVRDLIAMGRTPHRSAFSGDTPHDRALIEAAIELLELEAFQSRSFRSLSGGERQRVLLARALVQQPAVLVLDEPTNHLDLHHQLQLLEFVRDLGVTVIAALHDLSLAAMFCDRLCLLKKGSLVAEGTPETVLTAERLKAVYKVNATLTPHPVTGRPWIMPHTAVQ